jgi:hypothetical protein
MSRNYWRQPVTGSLISRSSARRRRAVRRRAGAEALRSSETVWNERSELLEDIRRMAGGLVDLANAAAARIQGREPAGPEEKMPESEAGDESPPGIATDESARGTPAIGSQAGGDDEPREQVAERTASRPDI